MDVTPSSTITKVVVNTTGKAFSYTGNITSVTIDDGNLSIVTRSGRGGANIKTETYAKGRWNTVIEERKLNG